LSVSLYHHFFVSQILFVWLITSLSSRSCGSLFCRFCLSTWLFIFYLWYFVCHLGLLCSFSDNFVCCLSLLDQGHSFAVIIYISSHHLIPLPAIYGSASYMSFVVVIYNISSALLNDQGSIL
jgi:hypothetical protein